MNEESNKFTESEIIIGGLFALGVDGLCALIDLTGVGTGVAPVIQGFSVFAIDRWVDSKGGTSWGTGKQMAQYASGLVPILPTTVAVFVIRVFMHNNPKLTEVAGKVVGKIEPAAGAAGKILKKAA